MRTLLTAVAIAIATATGVVIVLLFVGAHGADRLPPWNRALTTTAFGVLLVVGAAAPVLGIRVLRAGARLGVGIYLVALVALVPLAGPWSSDPAIQTLPWGLTSVGGIVLAALVAGGERLGWALLVLWIAVITVCRFGIGSYTLSHLANDSQAVLTGATVCLIGAGALRASRAVDRATASAESAVVVEADERARLAARARAAAFVHDEVLAALRGIVDQVPGAGDALRRQARRALRTVDDGVGHGDAIARLADLAAGTGFVVEMERHPDAVLPPEPVLAAVRTATAQAIQNSVRHAGDGVPRRLRITALPDALRVDVSDEGQGFDPARVRSDRLGLRGSILRVMRAVDGGDARVHSDPGKGTRVEIEWRASETSGRGPDATDERRRLRVGLGSVTAVFVVTQGAVAIAAAFTTGDGTALLTLFGILAVAEILRRARGSELSLRRACVASALLLTVVAVALVTTPAPLTYGTGWFAPAAGFVLVAIALQGRTGVASGAGVALLLLVVAEGVRSGAEVLQVSIIVGRAALIVGLGLLLVVLLMRLQRRIAEQSARAIDAARRSAWDAATREELEEHLADGDRLARPLLERAARGAGEDAAGRARARAIEGHLRDRYRAGRLLHGDVADRAAAARERGVDVVLLDDGGPHVDAAALAALAPWLSALIAAARERVVGRLLPDGSSVLARTVVDGSIHEFPRKPPESVAETPRGEADVSVASPLS